MMGFTQELPPIQNYSPASYNGENQNWAISQTDDKIIYVANSEGLLEFNGAKWTLFKSPNESIIRSVNVIKGKIYTGCYREFGFWQKNDLGSLDYTSISSKFKDKLIPDEEFWNIIDLGPWIAFQSLDRIYIYDTTKDSIKIIDSNSSLPKIFNIGSDIYFQKLNQGVFKIENARSVSAYPEKPFKEDEIINIFEDNQNLLVLTRHTGFYRIENNMVTKWNVASDSLLKEVSIYSALRLSDKSFVLGTISHGLIHLDKDGKLKYHIDQLSGLRNNTVLSLYEDADKNIWMGLDNGISYLNLKSPFRVYNGNKDNAGSVYTSALNDNYLYLGTNQGLYYKELGSNQNFKLINDTQGQVWSLNKIKGSLFCGHHTGTFIIEKSQAKKIAAVPGTWNIKPLDNKPDILIQGNYDGLHILERTAGIWKLKNKIEGFDNSARYFEVLNNEIFVSHEYKGLFRISVDLNYLKANNVVADTLLRGHNSGITKYKGQLLYSYDRGILKYDSNDKKFIADSLLANTYTPEKYVSGKMTVDAKNDYLWVFTNTNVSYVSQGNFSDTPIINSIPLTENARNGIIGYENVTALERSNKYLFGTSTGYITAKIDDFEAEDFAVNIGSVGLGGKSKNQSEIRRISKNQDGNFPNHENSIEISYHTASYDKYLKPSYQFQLLGIYPNWSDWSEESTATFENLPYGEYTFEVRAKIGDKVSGNIATYSFKIARPWYFSNLMLVLYAITAILGVILIHTLYRRYYHKRQQALIKKNKRDIELAKVQNEKEIIKIKNEQLKEEFKSKSNELAASTLSIIKKNELLSKVKEQLISSVEDKNSVKPIITIIDKSLNQNDDWELFKEAFNNADRKFLKKLKKAHPNLSPNDIRLCAYLRLNLSSKEIAPLLNISPRSVEIKRYRLRKKMDLSHDDNLVNYILKL